MLSPDSYRECISISFTKAVKPTYIYKYPLQKSIDSLGESFGQKMNNRMLYLFFITGFIQIIKGFNKPVLAGVIFMNQDSIINMKSGHFNMSIHFYDSAIIILAEPLIKFSFSQELPAITHITNIYHGVFKSRKEYFHDLDNGTSCFFICRYFPCAAFQHINIECIDIVGDFFVFFKVFCIRQKIAGIFYACCCVKFVVVIFYN